MATLRGSLCPRNAVVYPILGLLALMRTHLSAHQAEKAWRPMLAWTMTTTDPQRKV